MATVGRSLTSQDRKELDKFTKFLAIKTVQVIVQSRLGEKFKTKSKKFSSGADWFSVTIDDVPEVLVETKKALGGLLPAIGVTLCVEISLRTVEGESMVLETWCLGMIPQFDTEARITYTVYNRMGVLLKSLIAVTRVTPAYRLSCRQGPESYVICYRVHLGEPDLRILGEGYQQARVGQVGTPIGTFFLTVGFRTKLTITPQPVERDSAIMVKSDHFKPDWSPKRPHKAQLFADCRNGDHAADDLEAACEEGHELTVFPPTMSNDGKDYNGTNHVRHLNGFHVCERSPKYEREVDYKTAHDHAMSFSENKKVGAFAGETKTSDTVAAISEFFIPDTGFSSLLQHDHDNNIIHNKNLPQPQSKKIPNMNGCCGNNNNPVAATTTNGLDHSDMDTCSEAGSHESQKSTTSIASAATDDFVMVELKTPFATPDPTNDLSTFYRECQTAPPLDSFRNNPTFAEQVNDLTNQLATFEMNQHDFDELVDSLCTTDAWK